MIINKNLFDPERGAGASRDSEASAQAFQRVQNMVLVGTIIFPQNRTAILHDPGDSSRGTPNQARSPISLRMKVGDDFEGFTLSEIADKKVVFTKGSATVELALDYFKKIEMASSRSSAPGQIVAAGPSAARSIPNLPRRERLPVGPNR